MLFDWAKGYENEEHAWDNISISAALPRQHLSGRPDMANDETTQPDVRMKLSEMLEIFSAFLRHLSRICMTPAELAI